MKILAHSKESRGNELITYQFELPTYLIPELLKFKKMEITWNRIKLQKINNENEVLLHAEIIAEKLWKLLDNIDTLSDICKPTINDLKACMSYVNNTYRYVEERFNFIKSDGYELFNINGYSFKYVLITFTSSKPALMEFFDKCCPKYSFAHTKITIDGIKYNSWNDIKKIKGLEDKIFQEDLDDYTDSDKLRCNQNKTTDIHLQQIAEEMYDLYNESEVVELKEHEWHLPNYSIIKSITYKLDYDDYIKNELYKKYSTALISNPNNTDFTWICNECNTSNLTSSVSEYEINKGSHSCINCGCMEFHKETDYSKLIEIHDQLIKNNELDTFVHCARVMCKDEYNAHIKGKFDINYADTTYDDYKIINAGSTLDSFGWCDSFKGFISYKNIIENENNN